MANIIQVALLYLQAYLEMKVMINLQLFKSLQVEPTTTVNTSGTGYTKADLVIGPLDATTGLFNGNVDIIGS